MYAIEVKNVWKKYRIGRPQTLTKALPFFIFRERQRDFWALKGINLQIKRGETLGIIGPNGSGKSTFLKILSGITTSTKGKVSIIGRVASLLELGTGFHPELTGRENIYLYGTILGITKSEIKKNFNDIVYFSGVGKFLETPVKHYSSGMYIRLAFSVVIHLDWDILIVDEVLGVGDEQFQKKSSLKMEQIINSDKTLIFVSHNLEMVKRLCTRTVLLIGGRVDKIGRSDLVINHYLKNAQD